jgi:exopolyphosphatase/guanosine-5'-triphosphate,3'-diphosphate pyrophosphatase
MAEERELSVPRLGERPMGLLDVGTNSVRLLVVRRLPGGEIGELLDTRDMVRLGEGAYGSGALSEAAIDRTVTAFVSLCEEAWRLGAEHLYGVATSAVREASNGALLRDRIRAETGVEVRVISGEEEACLTYLGLASDLQPVPERLVTVDIGGGSTELAVGRGLDIERAVSLTVGAIRITEAWFGGGHDPIPEAVFEAARAQVRGLVPAEMADRHAVVVTAGGTGLNLAKVAACRWRRPDEEPVTREELAMVCRDLCALPLEQRREVPGLSRRRADIIPGGGAVLLGVLDALEAAEYRASERGLRHGLALLAARLPGLHRQRQPEQAEQ